jgi:hypothetical protein
MVTVKLKFDSIQKSRDAHGFAPSSYPKQLLMPANIECTTARLRNGTRFRAVFLSNEGAGDHVRFSPAVAVRKHRWNAEWATGHRHRKPSCRSNRGLEIWKTLRVSHIPTPPATTTDKCLTMIGPGISEPSGMLVFGRI